MVLELFSSSLGRKVEMCVDVIECLMTCETRDRGRVLEQF